MSAGFKEGDYGDLAYVMDGYIDKLKGLCEEKIRDQQKNSSRNAICIALLIVLIVVPSFFSTLGINISITTMVVTSLIVILQYLTATSGNPSITNTNHKIASTRRALVELTKYLSQINDHNKFSPTIGFLIILKLSEAEEIIHLTEQATK